MRVVVVASTTANQAKSEKCAGNRQHSTNNAPFLPLSHQCGKTTCAHSRGYQYCVRSQCRKRQKTAARAHTANSSHAAASAFPGCCQRKAKRYQRVERKSSAISRNPPASLNPRRRCIRQPVQQAIERNRDQRRQITVRRRKRRRQHANGKPRQC